MDGVREFLEAVRQQHLARGHLRGFLHVAIGRRVCRVDGTVLSTGLTWRELATHLKNLRFDKELVRELGVDPESLSPRDRERFWYSAIALAQVDSAEARADAESLAKRMQPLGLLVAGVPGITIPKPPGAS